MCDDAAGFIAVEPVHKPEFCPVANSIPLFLVFAGKNGGWWSRGVFFA